MAQRAVTIECAECGNKFTVKHNHPENVQYCPFCGEPCCAPTDDVDEDDYFPDDESEEEVDEED